MEKSGCTNKTNAFRVQGFFSPAYVHMFVLYIAFAMIIKSSSTE